MRAHRLRIVPVIGLVAMVATTGPVGADTDTVTLHAGLAGAREVPGPGDRDGSGTAAVEVDPATGEICYELTVRNVAPATAAHIHRGDRSQAGPVVQGLVPPSGGSSAGCVVNAPVAQAIAADPSGYYVNVHNAEFRGGAVRGQLAGPSA